MNYEHHNTLCVPYKFTVIIACAFTAREQMSKKQTYYF